MFTPAKRPVLVVDNESSIRENLERLLRSGGYEPVVAADGDEALERIAEQKFEAVLLDIKMPGPSGVAVLHRLKSDHPDTYVIMTTGVTDVERAVETMKLGAYDYILKPFNLDDVFLSVENAMTSRSLDLQHKLYVKNQEGRVEELTQRVQTQVA